MKQKYVYKPYNELFSKLFLQEKARLLSILNEECIDIEHVGSTAVPDLGGKGIVDIGITVIKQDIDNASRITGCWSGESGQRDLRRAVKTFAWNLRDS